MRYPDAPAPPDVCPICQSQALDGAMFCARCGTFLRGDGPATDGQGAPMVHLLTQVCALQRELLDQFRAGQALQARQFQRSLRLQSQQLERTLAHTARQAETSEQRVQVWQRWTAGLAAAVVGLAVVVTQIAG